MPSGIPRPPTQGQLTLPFVAIGDVAFEELCLDALRIEYPDLTSFALKRRRGMRQFGVDAEGFGASGHPTVVLSAKCYREVLPKYLEPWADDFIQELDKHWKGKKVEVFILAVTHDGNDDPFNDARRQISERLAEHNIRFELWTNYDLTASIRQDAGLVRRYFTDAWADAVSANEAGQVSAVIPRSAASLSGLGSLVSQIVDIADEGLRNRLKNAEREQSAGRSSDLKSFLFGDMAPALWDNSSPEVRAKLLRKKAILLLREGAVRKAREALGEAEGLAPAEGGYERAWLAAAESDVLSGLSLLEHVSNPREVILKATWLLQIQKADSAWTLLGTLALADMSCEALRVRALVACRRGDFASAAKDIAAARRLEPESASLSLSEGAILVASALAPGTTAEIGDTPNPIHAGLVRTGSAAITLLDQAARIFQELTVSTEPPFRDCAEIWLLATLLLHPAKRAEARRYFRVLAGRDDIDPITVAWGLQYGLPMRVGRIRRALTGPLRRGDAEPTHAIVLALLDGKSDRARGLATLQRYEVIFKDASEFFDDWRRKFGWRGGGADEDVSGIVIALSGNAEALTRHVLDNDVPSEELLAAASLLASRREWKAIVPLSDKLMALNTEEGVYLSARASWECKSPDDALKRLAEHSSRVEGGNLSHRLLQIRSEAHRAVGRAGDVISDLGAMLHLSSDPNIRQRRLGALATIGDIDAFEIEANAALARPGIPAREAVAIADFLKAHRPETARMAIEAAVRSGDESASLAPMMLSVATHLGLADIQQQLMPIVMSHADVPGTGVSSITIDDLPKFLANQAENSRRQMGEWLAGRMPASVAFSEGDYAKLFLGNSEERIGPEGEIFPMLLSGGKARTGVEPHSSNSRIVLDLSSLLLAFRLNILDSIQEAFQIEVVPSAPEALIAIEETLQSPSQSILAECWACLGPEAGLLSVVDDAEGIVIEWEETGLLQVAETAFNSGHLDAVQLETGRQAFSDDTGTPMVRVSGSHLEATPQAILTLARAKLLRPVARAYQIQMSASENEALRDLLRRSEREGRIRDEVIKLRKLTASRLSAGLWLMTPGDGAASQNLPIYPPVPRCLVEAVSAVEDRSKLVLIEDRFVARTDAPNCIDVVGLLTLLEKRGKLANANRNTCVRILRDIGYAFLDPNVPPILEGILSAAIADGVLVENDDLAHWRMWFARALQESRYVDVTLKQDAEGRVTGEPRYVLDLMGLARVLLLKIWRQDDNVEISRARSEWVWMAFRPEGGLALPAKPEGRLRLASTTLAYTFLAPFVEWTSEEVPLSPALKDMFEWFDEAVLVPAIAAEPALGDAIAEDLASALHKFVQVPSKVGGADREPIRKRLVARVHRFLSLLPSDWITKISNRRGLTETLGIRDQVSLTLRGGTKISGAALTEAVTNAMRSSDGADNVQLQGGGEAIVRVIQADGLITIQLTAEGSQLRLDPVTSALVIDDGELRRSAMAVGASRTAGYSTGWLKIAEIDGTDQRFAAAALMHEADFATVLEPFERVAEYGGRLDASYFALPEPATIRGYLGFGATDAIDAIGSEKAYSNLASIIGAPEAAKRFAALPLDLPATVRAEMAVALRSSDSLPPTTSPLLARALALAADDGEREDVEKLVRDSVRSAGRFFVAVVRRASAQANASSTWRALPRPERLSLIWTYAEAITVIFAPGGNRLDDLAMFVASIATPSSAFKPTETDGGWDGRLTNRLTARDLGAAIAADIARDWRTGSDTAPTQGLFYGLVGVTEEGAWAPHPEFSFPPPIAPPGFWAAQDPLEGAADCGFIPVESAFAVRDTNETVRAVLGGALRLAPGVGSALLGFAEYRDIDRALLPGILNFSETDQGEELFDPAKRGTGLALLAWAKSSGMIDEGARFIIALRKVAARCCETYPRARLGFSLGPDEPAMCVTTLMECTFEHADALEGSASARFDAIGHCARAIVEEWPGALRAVLCALDAALRASAADDAAPLAKHYSYLRSLC